MKVCLMICLITITIITNTFGEFRAYVATPKSLESTDSSGTHIEFEEYDEDKTNEGWNATTSIFTCKDEKGCLQGFSWKGVSNQFSGPLEMGIQVNDEYYHGECRALEEMAFRYMNEKENNIKEQNEVSSFEVSTFEFMGVNISWDSILPDPDDICVTWDFDKGVTDTSPPPPRRESYLTRRSEIVRLNHGDQVKLILKSGTLAKNDNIHLFTIFRGFALNSDFYCSYFEYSEEDNKIRSSLEDGLSTIFYEPNEACKWIGKHLKILYDNSYEKNIETKGRMLGNSRDKSTATANMGHMFLIVHVFLSNFLIV